MMNEIFDLCVHLLLYLAEITGLSYEEINVIIFCFIGPVVFVLQWVYIIVLRRRLNAKKI